MVEISCCKMSRGKDFYYNYCQTSNISCTKSQNLNVISLVLQLSLSNPLKPSVKAIMKLELELRRQAVLQLHLSDQQFYCLLNCALGWRFHSKKCIWKCRRWNGGHFVQGKMSWTIHMMSQGGHCKGKPWIILRAHKRRSIFRPGWKNSDNDNKKTDGVRDYFYPYLIPWVDSPLWCLFLQS